MSICVQILRIPLITKNSNNNNDNDNNFQDPARAALFGKPSKGKAIAGKNGKATKAQKGNESSDYESDSEDVSESEGSDIK